MRRAPRSASAWLVFGRLLALDPLWVSAGVVFAAGPVGLNVFVFAQHWVGVETAASAILISTALALMTITTLLVLLTPA